MYAGQRILAVVPARGGSKGVPLKNLQPVAGVSLVARVGAIVRQLPEIDHAAVSTDHEGIAAEAARAGLSADWRRPAELSGDRIGDLDVLLHALTESEQRLATRFDIVLMLQPTSPMRSPTHVRDTYRKLVDESRDAVWTISETDPKYHPRKQLTLECETLGYYTSDGGQIIARQQLASLYHRNGAAYAFTRECLVEQRTIMGANTAGLVTEDMVSIDTHEDFDLVEFLMDRRSDSQAPSD